MCKSKLTKTKKLMIFKVQGFFSSGTDAAAGAAATAAATAAASAAAFVFTTVFTVVATVAAAEAAAVAAAPAAAPAAASVPEYQLSRVPSCNARKRMKLQEGAAYKNHLRGTFESIVLKDLPRQGKLKEAPKRNNLQDRKQEDGTARRSNETSERLRQSVRGHLGKPTP